MKTSLSFAAPADLSVGRVTIENESGVVSEWVATPNTRGLELEDCAPGLYSVEITPAGMRPQSFVFEVKPDLPNVVAAPLYSALAAGGAAATFQGIEDPREAAERLHRSRKHEPSQPARERLAVRTEPAPTPPVTSARVLTIGLAQDEKLNAFGGWRPYFETEPTIEFATGGGLNLLIAPPRDAVARNPRIRLSAALEGVRVERMMIPLFVGGTRVAFQNSPLVTPDVAIQVTPLDPERRALLRALHAGVEDEAVAVFRDILGGGSIGRFVEGDGEDPWAAMIAALLAVRFPAVFGDSPADWGPMLADRYPWASDTHVVLARHHLMSAQSGVSRKAAANDALNALLAAQSLGSPYFAYANQLMGEMLGGLAALRDFDETLVERAELQLSKWRDDVPLQRSAGAIFSWLRSDPKLRRAGSLQPYRSTRGNLSDRYSRIVFRGQVDLNGVSVLAPAASTAPKAFDTAEAASGLSVAASIDGSAAVLASGGASPSGRLPEAPALARPVTVYDDPNAGRFGGAASAGGYGLSATFREASDATWVDVDLVVRAERSRPPSYSDTVEFFLHPTFNPSRIKVTFRGHEAALSVRAWGGFTVGAWLPEHGVELECDLASAAGAPRVIREL